MRAVAALADGPVAVLTVCTDLPSSVKVSVVMLVDPSVPVTVWVTGSP